MKRFSFVSLSVCVFLGSVYADYMNSPGWENDPYFTHQSWSFTSSQNPAMPDDGGAGNPYGTAILTMGDAQWIDDLGMMFDPGSFDPLGQRQGGWGIDGPQQDATWITIDIPNAADPGRKKELWYEITFRVSSMQLAEQIVNKVDLRCYAEGIIDEAHEFTDNGYNGGVIGVDEQLRIWLRFWGTFEFDPQPQSELFVLTGTLDAGQGVLLDQIDIDTRCVPEPTTLCLLAIGALGMIRRRR
ncbi:MAG: PEP-CTERM sorting domain-containing protein [Sedimentisphaerales bacterium]|nr:PEP-CTERM sorting domain-containing protein [Sedimentisphaerales bacterium]